MSEREERMQKFKDAAANEERMNQLVNELRGEQLELRERRKDMEIRATEREAREAEEKAKNREQVRVRSGFIVARWFSSCGFHVLERPSLPQRPHRPHLP